MDRPKAKEMGDAKMHIVRSKFCAQPDQRINSVVRNTSCSRGWLRLVVQLLFGAITVGSFVLILLMALQRLEKPQNRHCQTSNCMIECGKSHFDRRYEDDIISAVQEISPDCRKITLILRNVQFTNQTLPINWMNRMSSNIDRLYLAGGNLHHIPHSAFVGQFAGKLTNLIFEDLTITMWSPDTLVGLSNLKSLFITNTVIEIIERNALNAVDDTLQALTVTNSGKWNPRHVTGMSSLQRLHRVDFSLNNFGDIINNQTFKSLKQCRVLFLNSCKITTIGAGAFDHLEKLQMLFLNDNYLTTIPPGLFSTISSIEEPKPRIHLQDNRWRCDCSLEDLMYLFKNDFLLVDVMCYQPVEMNGKTISNLIDHCKHNYEDVKAVILPSETRYETEVNATLQPCIGARPQADNEIPVRIISPLSQFTCDQKKIGNIGSALTHYSLQLSRFNLLHGNTWLKSTLLFQTNKYSIIQLGSSGSPDYGLVWFQSLCPDEIYCINVLPNYLRVYISTDAQYIFCPFELATGQIDVHNCATYDSQLHRSRDIVNLGESPGLFIITGFFCLLFGALCVYGIIRKNPSLLKGSKRLLFVKHRNVEALVLPPKVPLRNSLSDEDILNQKKTVFTVLDDSKLNVTSFNRSDSFRSDKSHSPTYVSAMQPTDAQLAEWRLRNHFDQNSSIISITSDRSMFSWTYESINKGETNIAYTSLK